MRNIILLGSGFVAFVGIAFCTSMVPIVNASVAASFTPTSTITVEMWQLEDWGAKKTTLCSQDAGVKYTWGCTAYCNNSSMCPGVTYVAYPFYSSSATVQIEGQRETCSRNSNPYNCYLRDVVPAEIFIRASSRNNKPASALEAQAIAARTFAYHRTWGITNSNDYQVFVPFYYDTLSTDQQDSVDAAVANRYYMSYYQTYTYYYPSGGSVTYESDHPIAALYGSDNGATTVKGDNEYPYLVSVQDSISAERGQPVGTGSGGMSSNGASRWGFGHTSERGPAFEWLSYYPHDNLGNGNFWSIQWDNSFQILTHYYTRIHIRDANGNILTPSWRGNVLQVKWSRPRGYPNGICSRIEVWLQNTGTTTWYGADQGYYGQQVGIGYCWNGGPCAKAGYLPKTIEPGHDLWVTLLVPPGSGSGDLQIDLYRQMFYEYDPAWFSLDWPRQGIGTFSAVPNYCTRLPLMTSREPIH